MQQMYTSGIASAALATAWYVQLKHSHEHPIHLLGPQVVKLLQSGGVEWEQGDDRSVMLPVLSPLLAGCSTLKVTGTFGDPGTTLVQLEGDQVQIQVGKGVRWSAGVVARWGRGRDEPVPECMTLAGACASSAPWTPSLGAAAP